MQIICKHLLVLALSICWMGCYFSDNSASAPPPGSVSFENDVIPIFDANCTAGCHSGGAPAGGLSLSTDDSDVATVYADVSAEINVGNPASSNLLAKASNTVAHTAGEVLATSSEDYQTILSWIEDGAPDN